MRYFKNIEEFKSSKKTAVTLGKFDGFHKGHQSLLKRVNEYKKNHDVETLVVAFDMKPLLSRLYTKSGSLMTNEERKIFLEDQVDCLVECPFTEEFCHIQAEAFIETVLLNKFHAEYVVVGEDFRFGFQQQGDGHLLKEYGKKYGFEVVCLPKERYEERIISSSYIREEVADGNMELAESLLGYTYSLTGTVRYGKQLGRTLGFPTLNVIPDSEKLLPPNGVYLARVKLRNLWYDSITNIGVKPTVSEEKEMVVESFLLDYEGDAYGETITIQLCRFQRGEVKFASTKALKQQVDRDITYGKIYFRHLHSKKA